MKRNTATKLQSKEEKRDTDSKLIAEVAKGSEEAFEKLVRYYQRQVLSTIYRYIGDANAAQDVAQEVFCKVWSNASGFKHKSSFSTWLYRIVVNHCLNYQAKRKRRQTEPLDERMADEGASADERFEQERKVHAVREAVDKLSARQRMALILSRFEGRSYSEISEIMKTSLSSVESLIFRAKDNLKKILLPLKQRGDI